MNVFTQVEYKIAKLIIISCIITSNNNNNILW